MDDLDRLYFELVEVRRAAGPAALREPIAVRDLHERLVPYRRVRDAVGFRTNGDYEIALSRLLAGERGYLQSEAGEMRAAIREGLGQPIPDARRYLAYPEAVLRMDPAEIPPPGDRRYAPPGLRTPDPEPPPGSSDPDLTPEREVEPEGGDPGGAAPPGGTAEPGGALEPGGTPEPPEAPEPLEASEPWEVSGAPGPVTRCADCGSEIGEPGFAYCPYCGAGLSAACPACGTELASVWRFCPMCGRGRDTGSEGPEAAG